MSPFLLGLESTHQSRFSPYDTGDRCFVDSAYTPQYRGWTLKAVLADENLVVKNVGLFAVRISEWHFFCNFDMTTDRFCSFRWHGNVLFQQSTVHKVHVSPLLLTGAFRF